MHAIAATIRGGSNFKPQERISLVEIDSGCLAAAALARSSGTKALTDADAGAGFYAAGAIIPRGPWRSLSAAEVETLRSRGSYRPHLDIGLAKIADANLEEMVKMLASIDYNPRICVSTSSAVKEVVGRFEDHLRERFRAQGQTVSSGLKNNAPGLATIAINRRLGTLAGLHMDGWDGGTWEERARSRIRISVNIGPEPRYFLFANASIHGMQRALREERGMDVDINETWQTFAREFPDFPMTRITLNPGYAYVAATDCIVHDGATDDASRRTFVVQMRAHFNV